MEDAGQWKEGLVVAKMLGRGHSGSDGRRTGAEFGNRIGSRCAAKGSTVGGDVIGLAIGPLDVPGVWAHSDGVCFPVTDVSILIAGRTEPSSRKVGVGSHFSELVTCDLRASLFLSL